MVFMNVKFINYEIIDFINKIMFYYVWVINLLIYLVVLTIITNFIILCTKIKDTNITCRIKNIYVYPDFRFYESLIY